MDGNLPLNSGKQRKQGRAGQVEGKDTLPALKQMLQLMEIRNVLRPIYPCLPSPSHDIIIALVCDKLPVLMFHRTLDQGSALC